MQVACGPASIGSDFLAVGERTGLFALPAHKFLAHAQLGRKVTLIVVAFRVGPGSVYFGVITLIGVHGLGIEEVLGVEGESWPEELCVSVGLGKSVLDELADVDTVGIGLVETLAKGDGFSL